MVLLKVSDGRFWIIVDVARDDVFDGVIAESTKNVTVCLSGEQLHRALVGVTLGVAVIVVAVGVGVGESVGVGVGVPVAV